MRPGHVSYHKAASDALSKSIGRKGFSQTLDRSLLINRIQSLIMYILKFQLVNIRTVKLLKNMSQKYDNYLLNFCCKKLLNFQGYYKIMNSY
jgi:hypothetical protein